MAAGPGTIHAESIRFAESAGSAAGVYAGSIVIPKGAVLIDCIVTATALWTAGTSAALIVGDATDPNGIYDAVDLKATDLLAGESLSFAFPAGQFGAYLTVDYTSVATIGASYVDTRGPGAARTMSAQVTTVGTLGTAGVTEVIFVYAYPSPVAATFTAT